MRILGLLNSNNLINGVRSSLGLVAAFFFLGVSSAARGQIIQRSEPVLGFMAESYGVWVQVPSGGCTDRSSFDIVKRFETSLKAWKVELVRVNHDACLAIKPYGEKIFLSYDELGINPGERVTFPTTVNVIRRW